jgi:hypothetical protein
LERCGWEFHDFARRPDTPSERWALICSPKLADLLNDGLPVELWYNRRKPMTLHAAVQGNWGHHLAPGQWDELEPVPPTTTTSTTTTTPGPHVWGTLLPEDITILAVLEHARRALTQLEIMRASVRLHRKNPAEFRRLADSTLRTRLRVLEGLCGV